MTPQLVFLYSIVINGRKLAAGLAAFLLAEKCKNQKWSPQGRPLPREHTFKCLASAPKLKLWPWPRSVQSPRKCPVLGSRKALFFDWLKRKKTKDNISDSQSIRWFFFFLI